MRSVGPDRDRQRNRNESKAQQDKGWEREDIVAHQPSQDGKMLTTQRVFPLQKNQKHEKKNKDRTADVIEKRDWFHLVPAAARYFRFGVHSITADRLRPFFANYESASGWVDSARADVRHSFELCSLQAYRAITGASAPAGGVARVV